MIKRFGFAACILTLAAIPAAANDYLEFPVEAIAQSIPRSYPTGRLVVIPPYDHLFQTRVYTTPPTPPYYNVPPYAVVTPF